MRGVSADRLSLYTEAAALNDINLLDGRNCSRHLTLRQSSIPTPDIGRKSQLWPCWQCHKKRKEYGSQNEYLAFHLQARYHFNMATIRIDWCEPRYTDSEADASL